MDTSQLDHVTICLNKDHKNLPLEEDLVHSHSNKCEGIYVDSKLGKN